MKIKFLGAAGTVTGSSFLLVSDSGKSLLVDCGLFQGSDELEKLNYEPLGFDIQSLEGVILTHAHLDHCGRLPLLPKTGFSKSIFMTPPTKDLSELSLYDSAKINKSDKENVLYTSADVESIVSTFKTQNYDSRFRVGGFDVVFRDAGHILGSASVEVSFQENGKNSKIVFSGDLGNSPQDLIKKTEPIGTSDYVVMESTYGDKSHPKDNPSQIILSEINEIEKTKSTLLIPAFSIERSQEILHRISHLKKMGKIGSETRIFFDSPMAEKATVIFEKYRSYYNDELRNDFAQGDPFNFSGLITITKSSDSRAIDLLSGPKVIISGSGMMTGGRIVSHARAALGNQNNRILFVGYQSEGTLGRLILEGHRNLRIDGSQINVVAHVSETQAMSSHADQPRLLSWLKDISGVKTAFLVHGEDSPRNELKNLIKTANFEAEIVLPMQNQEVQI